MNMKAGYTITSTRSFQQPSPGVTQAAGATECVYSFGPDNADPPRLVRFVLDAAANAWPQGVRPWVTFGINFSDVTAGLWSKAMGTLAKKLEAMDPGGRVVLAPGAYRESSIARAPYCFGFNRFASDVRAGGRQVQTCWASRVQTWTPGVITDAAIPTWGEIQADIYAIDVRPVPEEAGMILPEFAGFRRWHETFIASGDKPWAVMERLFPAADVQRATVLREQDWLLHSETGPGCAAYLVGNPEGSTHGLSEGAEGAVLDLLAAIKAPPAEADRRYHFRPVGHGLVAHGWTGLVVADGQQADFLRWLTETSPTLMADLGTLPQG